MATVYKSRSAWTSTSAGGSTLTGSELVGVAVHWPGTTAGTIGVESESQTASRLRGYRNFHVNTRGWADIGYNFAIDQAGRVWQLRTTSWKGNRVGAHAASASNPRANHKYVGVLLIIGASEQPSAAMIRAFQDWYHDRFLPGWPGRTDVRGHGQVAGASTDCPGSRTRALISDGTLKNNPGSSPPPGGTWLEMATKEEVKAVVKEAFKEQLSISGLASDTLPDAWNKSLYYLSAYGAMAASPTGRERQATDVWGRDNPTLETQYGSIARYMYNAIRPDRSQTPGARVGFLQDLDRIEEICKATLAAAEGLDEETVLARIDQHSAETKAQAQQAESVLQELASRVDEIAAKAESERNSILLLLEQHSSGDLSAEAVVDALFKRLALLAPEDTESGN